MPKLYAVMLGGRVAGCHIELHDVVFVVGDSLEELYPHLVNKWFGGDPHRLHVDASVELSVIDGHEIILRQDKPAEPEAAKLYFVNFGGYKPNFFGELHEMHFYVGHKQAEITAKAKQDLCVGQHQQHLDDGLIIDDVMEITSVDRYYIHLQPTDKPEVLNIEAHYRKLNLPAILEKAEALKELC